LIGRAAAGLARPLHCVDLHASTVGVGKGDAKKIDGRGHPLGLDHKSNRPPNPDLVDGLPDEEVVALAHTPRLAGSQASLATLAQTTVYGQVADAECA